MKLSYGKKLLFTFIFYGMLICCVAILAIYTITSQNIKQDTIKEAQAKALEKIDYIHNYYSSVYDKLHAVQQSKTFTNYLKNKNNYGTVRELFLNIAYTSKNIMQLRYIDNKGNEIIRVDRKSIQSNPVFINFKQLQNKSHRYYYDEIMSTPQDKIWHSEIDLNVENGEVQKPFQAVLRVGAPIFINNKRNGFLIINIFMNKLLHDIIQSPTYNIYVIDEKGYFKAHSNSHRAWTNYKKYTYKVQKLFPNEAEAILSYDEYKTDNLFSKNINSENLKNTKIIVEAKVHAIQKELNEQVQQLILVMIGIILLSFPFAYLFAKTPTKLKEKVDKLNANLENKINEKTFELQELNANLEKRIQEEVKENSRKDTLLFHQNKIASLGEMLRNIAHQWRQPLTAMTTAASGLKLQKEMKVLDDEGLDSAINMIMKNSTYLSKTIDDFRNFFQKDKTITKLNLAQAIKDDLNLLSPTLKNNYINVVINLDESIEIETIKNELTQVHLNLISNAKDVLTSEKNKELQEKLISVELLKENDNALIRVIDNGGGIDDTVINHIFEPYFTTKHKTQGTGIGLFMCEEIICNHLKGSIRAFNKEFTYNGENYQGALFEIRLPLETMS